MINERILNEEFFMLLDTVQSQLNWDMSLETFEISNASIAGELQYNNSLEDMAKEIMSSNKGLSFLMIGFRAVKSPVRTKEVLMRYAFRLGYAVHQLDVTDIANYDGMITYDEEFESFEVDKYFELMADFLCDDCMSLRCGLSNVHHESFIYFAMLLGYIIRGQIQKHKLRTEFGLDVIKTRKYKKSLAHRPCQC